MILYNFSFYKKHDSNLVIRVINCSYKHPQLNINILIDQEIVDQASIDYNTCHEWSQTNCNLTLGYHKITVTKKDDSSVVLYTEDIFLSMIKVIDLTFNEQGEFDYEHRMYIPKIL